MSQFTVLAQAAGGSGGFPMIMIFVLMFGIMYLLVLRPQQKQMKQHAAMLAALKKGDEVVTSGGLMGRVAVISDKVVTLEIANGVKVRVTKQSIQGIAGALGEAPAASKSEAKEEK